MQIKQYFLSDGGVRGSDLDEKEEMFLRIWTRFKINKLQPHQWLTNGVLTEEHLNGIVEMQKLANKKLEMDQDLAHMRSAAKQGTTVSKGF